MQSVHPHLPRAVTVTLALALATIVIMLALAARLGDIQLGQSQLSITARPTPTPATPHLTDPPTPGPLAWLTHPFTPLTPDSMLRWTPAAGRR